MLNPEQASLLRAAWLDGDGAQLAYEEWRSQVRFDDVGAEAYRLLPWLARNLRRLGVEDDLSARLRGIERRAWYANQLALRAVADGVAALSRAGIESRVLGGGLAILHHQAERGPYPVEGVDLLLRVERTDDALAALGGLQWSLVEQAGDAWVLTQDGVFLAIHPQELPPDASALSAELQDHPWQRPLVMRVGQTTLWLVNPEAQAILAAERLGAAPARPPLHPIVEMAALLTSGVIPVKWDELLRQVRLRHTDASLLALLRPVVACLPGAVPHEAHETLDALMTPAVASGTSGAAVPAAPRFVWQRLLRACGSLWRSYARTAGESESSASVLGFVQYLVRHWDLASAWRLPWAIGWRAWRVLWGADRARR